MGESDPVHACGNCVFFRGEDGGDCRRYAPRAALGAQLAPHEGHGSYYEPSEISGATSAFWPHVFNDHWCGEWSQGKETRGWMVGEDGGKAT